MTTKDYRAQVQAAREALACAEAKRRLAVHPIVALRTAAEAATSTYLEGCRALVAASVVVQSREAELNTLLSTRPY
jgi:hypothetical protein